MIAEIWGTTPGGEGVAQEDVRVAARARPRPPGCARRPESLRPTTGAPIFMREVHDLADLLGVRLGEAAPEHGEVLGEDVDETAVDPAVAGDDAVAGDLLLRHAEVQAAVLDELVQLLEGRPRPAGAPRARGR